MPDTDQLSDTQGSYTPAPSSEAALAEHRVHELACCRISPRPCVNQRLVGELSVLREWRFLQHGSELRDSSTSLTSSDAHPSPHFLLRLAAPPESLSYATAIGDKLIVKIREFLDKGFIQQSRHTLANKLYDEGAHNLDDLREMLKDRQDVTRYLKYHADLQENEPGAHLELCGGYRRGKLLSGDIDILVTFPHRDGLERGVLRRLVHRLTKKGLIPPDGVLSLTEAGSTRTTYANRPASLLDTLDKALVVLRHPANGTSRKRDVWRRVDLVVAAWPHWGSAVLGWTGSTQFERDLRRWAGDKGFVFDSGGIRVKATNQYVPAQQEKDCFRVLGLDWIECVLRALSALALLRTGLTLYRAHAGRICGMRTLRRRYSDFVSLRQALATLHPCFIVPPLPPKNTLASYAIVGAHPSKAKEDAALIARRRRMLSTFLNRTLEHRTLGTDRVFRRFLDPETPWVDVLHSPPVTLVPKNPLRAPASDPTDPDLLALFANLPLPSSSAALQHPDQRFLDSEVFTNKFSAHLSGSMEKVNRRLMKRWTDAAGDWGEMGGGLNGFALRMGEDGTGGLDEATEKVGMAVDAGYTLTNSMLGKWEQDFTEPLQEYTQFSSTIKGLLKYRHSKHLQYEAARELLESKRATLEELERSELEAQRLEKALERVRIVTDDGDSERAVSPPNSNPGAVGAAAENPGAAAGAGTLPPLPSSSGSLPSPPPRKGGGLLSALSHSVKGFVDSDPESTRRSSIGKTREQINQLDDAIKALTNDLRFASSTIQGDLDRFQRQKVGDLREMCLDFAHFHREWAAKVRLPSSSSWRALS
ncbi:sorting nexin-41 [Rhodotorula diobovata]|uniref:Sorting nexin-41 n=1 Tax=Rhodotorula diobovata TaxID=5288 RepID=A0A5C5FKF8_9BASI|nr:sorting nexin-41 [Rhodotorula diobovata]